MKKLTRFPKKLEWMRPYLELGMSYLSEGVFIERVGAWSLGSSRGKRCHAALIRDSKGKYRIWIHTHYEIGEKNEVEAWSKIDMLKLLAHELAHLELAHSDDDEWNHTPKHLHIESKISIAFMKMLHQEGYISQEDEQR